MSYNIPSFMTYPSRTIFITSGGIDVDHCGSEQSPCGTIWFASALSMFNQNFSDIFEVSMYVTGQNAEEIVLWRTDNKLSSNISFMNELRNDWYYQVNWTPCTFWEYFNKSVEVTFDPNAIHSMNDWYPSNCSKRSNNFYLWKRNGDLVHETTTIFNNLFINDITIDTEPDYQVLLQFKDEARLILNNCSFYNINRTFAYDIDSFLSKSGNALMDLTTAYFYHTTFHNIIIDAPSPEIATFIEIDATWRTTHDISFSMDGCYVTNYSNTDGPFLRLYAANTYSDTRRLSIHNSIFSNVDTTSALIVSSSQLNSWHITVNLSSCDFLNINLGSVLITQDSHSVFIQDTVITTRQLVKDLIDRNEDHPTLSLFVFGDDAVEMNRITLRYTYDTTNNCEHKEQDLGTAMISLDTIRCLTPIQFMQTEGVVTLNQFNVSNDIEYNEITQLYPCDLMHQCQFAYIGSELDYALLQNDGFLTINGFYIHGVGIASQLLLNRGNAFIDDAISLYDYYHPEFHPFTLNTHVLFRNEGHSVFGGRLEVNNSYLYGADYVAFHLSKGSATIIRNTVIDKCQTAVIASPHLTYLSLDSVRISNIGPFYTSYLNSFMLSMVPPPLLITAQETVIKNSHFSFFDPRGFIVSSPEAWAVMLGADLSQLIQEETTYAMTLINNSFEVNTEHGLMALSDMQQLQTLIEGFGTFGGEADTLTYVADQLKALRYNASATFQFGCMICIYPNTLVRMIGNIFYGIPNTLDDTTPFLAIDNAPHINCISSNVIYGYALHLISGTVTSCHRSQLVDIMESAELITCWSAGLGELDPDYTSYAETQDSFIATQRSVPLILVESAQSIYSAESMSFATADNEDTETTYNAIEIISGKVFIFHVDLKEPFDITFHDNCQVNCFERSRLNDSDYNVLQLNIECETNKGANGAEYNAASLLLDTPASFKNHLSAYSVELKPATVYYPGGKLFLNYTIYDMVGNKITDYNQDIFIKLILQSSALHLNLQMDVFIDSTGKCAICEEGIFIQTISTGEVGEAFTMSTSMESEFGAELMANPITFNVTSCQSGSGQVGVGKQCGLCEPFHFSFLPTTAECFSCNNINEYASGAGFQCHGGNSVTIDYNVWFSLVYGTQFVSPLQHPVTQDDTIYTSQCPPRQCCQSFDGCSLLDTTQLCALNRDPNVPLCGQCLNGTYELFGTASCGDCSSSSHLAYFIPIFIVVSLLFVFVLMLDAKEMDVTDYIDSELNFKKIIKRDEKHCISIMISKIFVYYYQSLSQILYSKGIEHMLSPVLSVFDLSFQFGSNSSNGICIFPFITNPLIKILLHSMFILLALFHTCWVPCTLRYIRRHQKAAISTMGRVVALQIFVISCSTLLNISFKLLSCITFPSGTVHFFHSTEQCFSGYWILGLLLFLFVICAFMVLAYKIYKEPMEERYSHRNLYRKMIKAYNPSEWWWEFVLFSRRVTIALCTSIRNVNAMDLDIILLTLLLVYFGCHVRKLPFKYQRLNLLESICLMVLILIFAVFSDDFTTKYTGFTNYFVAFAILLPFIMMAYYIIRTIHVIASSSASDAFTQKELRMIKKAKKRAPILIDANTVSDDERGSPFYDTLENKIKSKSDGELETEDENAIPAVTVVSQIQLNAPMDDDDEKEMETVVMDTATGEVELPPTIRTKTQDKDSFTRDSLLSESEAALPFDSKGSIFEGATKNVTDDGKSTADVQATLDSDI